MRTALFLGAGASAFVGLPTTKELMNKVRTRVKNEKDGRELSQITKLIISDGYYLDVEKLYNGIDRMLSLRHDVPNLVPIFNVLHGSDPTFKQTLDELGHTRSIIRNVLLDSFSIKSNAHNQIVQMYDMVRSVMNDGGTGEFLVFTTNYDTVLEKYCDMKRLDVANGFKPKGRGAFVWADKWSADTANYMHLIKLHGSIFWHRDADGNIVESGVVASRDADHDIMIAPTEGKKDYSKEPFSSLVNHFEKEIGDVDVLLVIGFSYRDDDIVDIIKDRIKDGMALISVSLEDEAETDIARVSEDKIETVDINGHTLKTIGGRIMLVEQEFGPSNINRVRASLEAACDFVRNGASDHDDSRSGVLVDNAPWSAELFDTITYKGHAWTAKKRMVDLLVSVAEWLVQKGHLTAKHCPIEIGPKNYLLHTEPKHQNGKYFFKYKPLEKGMYLNTDFSADGMIRHSIGLMAAAGLDRSEIRLENRRL